MTPNGDSVPVGAKNPINNYGAIQSSESVNYDEKNFSKNQKASGKGLKDSKIKRRRWLVTMVLGALAVISSFLLYLIITITGKRNAHLGKDSCDSIQNGFHCESNISHYWGQYSPFFSVPSEITADVPDQCQITFAQILSRHGARDPTLKSTRKYRDLIDKIHSSAVSYSNSHAFIKNYKYNLGSEKLTLFGQQQMVNSGIKFYNRYNTISRKTIPFIRASGQMRVIESAKNWTQGFHQARSQDSSSTKDSKYPYDIVVISEDAGSNNTLDHGLCKEFEEGYMSKIGHTAKETWASIFTQDITARLNSNMPGANLTTKETIYLMDLCPFETVANNLGVLSPFCSLFTEKEWQAYDYYESLAKYYGYSWGNPLGPTQGVGFTNEFIARITKTSVDDHTSTNSTLDNDPDKFPIGEKTVLYADFSHDNTMISIFAAMGLYNSTPPLSNTTLEDETILKGYSASRAAPFGARAYFEKMKCKGIDEELIRIIVNDRVMPLETCGADELGRCTLGNFVNSLDYAKNGGSWDQC